MFHLNTQQIFSDVTNIEERSNSNKTKETYIESNRNINNSLKTKFDSDKNLDYSFNEYDTIERSDFQDVCVMFNIKNDSNISSLVKNNIIPTQSKLKNLPVFQNISEEKRIKETLIHEITNEKQDLKIDNDKNNTNQTLMIKTEKKFPNTTQNNILRIPKNPDYLNVNKLCSKKIEVMHRENLSTSASKNGGRRFSIKTNEKSRKKFILDTSDSKFSNNEYLDKNNQISNIIQLVNEINFDNTQNIENNYKNNKIDFNEEINVKDNPYFKYSEDSKILEENRLINNRISSKKIENNPSSHDILLNYSKKKFIYFFQKKI